MPTFPDQTATSSFDAELTGDHMSKGDVIEVLEALNFRTTSARKTLRIDREVRTLLLDALRRRV